ncbi:MAG: Ribosomal protein L14 [Candidatus Methanohalarchaeum thermophilum]|uniref:Large ribosomal subunit protein uL14 n=1 Tax=Methanohalarchaeum thermophilum TaxID=1903181 RepID=A0A1Q6DX08_METT1|nr:MAG: Ribosomal protein L14 [Candidatus Methanohalarchaeum thermophilum]
MRGIKASVTKGIQTGTKLNCADNTGARVLEFVSAKEYNSVRRRQPKAGISDKIVVSVKEGDPEMKKQVLDAVIIRQKKEYRRPDGLRVQFEDNAAVLVDEAEETKGTEIKGPVAKEAAERFPKVASAATMII